MFKLSIRTWVRNAAAVFSGHHGDVAEQARGSSCSRQTVYEHARAVERRLAQVAQDRRRLAELEAENRGLRRELAELRQAPRHDLDGDRRQRRRFAVTAFAMGVSLRQIEDLFGLLLPPGDAPDHSTIGRWAEGRAQQAGRVLAALDPACAPRVRTLAVDEIFFGGDRRWSASSRRA